LLDSVRIRGLTRFLRRLNNLVCSLFRLAFEVQASRVKCFEIKRQHGERAGAVEFLRVEEVVGADGRLAAVVGRVSGDPRQYK